MRSSSLPSTSDIAILLAVAGDATTPYAITKKLSLDLGGHAILPDRNVYRALHRLAAERLLIATPQKSETGKPLPASYALSQEGRNLLIIKQKHYQHMAWLIRQRIH